MQVHVAEPLTKAQRTFVIGDRTVALAKLLRDASVALEFQFGVRDLSVIERCICAMSLCNVQTKFLRHGVFTRKENFVSVQFLMWQLRVHGFGYSKCMEYHTGRFMPRQRNLVVVIGSFVD